MILDDATSTILLQAPIMVKEFYQPAFPAERGDRMPSLIFIHFTDEPLSLTTKVKKTAFSQADRLLGGRPHDIEGGLDPHYHIQLCCQNGCGCGPIGQRPPSQI